MKNNKFSIKKEKSRGKEYTKVIILWFSFPQPVWYSIRNVVVFANTLQFYFTEYNQIQYEKLFSLWCRLLNIGFHFTMDSKEYHLNFLYSPEMI